jgi:Phosphodiester glycosidase
MTLLTALTALVALLATRAEAEALQRSTPFTGVTVLRLERSHPRPLRMVLVDIDLTAPGVSVEASPGNGRGPGAVTARRPSTVAREEGYAVCINAAVYRPEAVPEGVSVIVDGPVVRGGRVLAPVKTRRHAICIDADGRASIRETPLGDVREAVAGFDLPPCLVDGRISGPQGAPHPRTVVGVSRDGTRLFLLVVDGRHPGISEGCTHHEAATWLMERGAWDAIVLDGGASSTMVVVDADGTPRVANAPVGLLLPGTERAVATCLGVRASPRPVAVETAASPADEAPPSDTDALTAALAVLSACAALLIVILVVRRGTAGGTTEHARSGSKILALYALGLAPALAALVYLLIEGDDPVREEQAPAARPTPDAPDRARASRAAWWQSSSGVVPIADLVNTPSAAGAPRFGDLRGGFAVRTFERSLIITGSFPRPSVYRFDLTTLDGRFDMRRLYVPHGGVAFPDPDSVTTRALSTLLGPEAALTHTGPWEIFSGEWKVPTARVSLDGRHVYTSWFDLPSLEDREAGRVYASFALDIETAGEHAIAISFDDFVRHTRWRPSARSSVRPAPTVVPNPLRPRDIGSIAIGEDERVRSIEEVPLLPSLVGVHPRLPDAKPWPENAERLGLESVRVQRLITHLDPDRGELWEYCDDAESMASGNDMDAGRSGLLACVEYDRLVPRMTDEARAAVDRVFLKRFEGIYRYFVFQRNYNATAYAQNHLSKAIWALVGAGLVGDGPQAAKWRRWAVMTCRKRVELLGRDGGLELGNEARDYGLGFWERARLLILHCTGRDLAQGGFFENEWRYALHSAPAFPENRVPVLISHHGVSVDENLPLPAHVSADSTPTSHWFDDCDQVFMRTGWSSGALRMRLTAGSVFGKTGTPQALRFNWAHCAINRGSVSLWQGGHPLLGEPGVDRTYRKSAGNNNCILVNDTDQWGSGSVYHPRLRLDQVGRVAFFADGSLMSVARADLKGAYPPRARIAALSRVLVQLRPDHFLVFDRVETDGPGKAQWRFHAAFVEPSGTAGRYTVYAGKTNPGRHESYAAAFSRLDDVNAQIAFLTPGTKAEVKMSDPYFRGSGLRQPMRHLRVVREADGPLTLLTAVAPRIGLEPAGEGVFTGRSGSISWLVLVGPGRDDRYATDGHLTVVARDESAGRVECFRFGGRKLRVDGADLPYDCVDLFAVIQDGSLSRVVVGR